MNYIGIDFEVANTRSRSSICSVGLTQVQNGEIVREYYTLINPHDEFDPYCVAVHGITEDMVAKAPNFADAWTEMAGWIKGQTLVAHNASFDISVLKSSLEAYGLDYPECTYVCSYLLSRKIWPGLPGYRLNEMAAFHKLEAFRHHDALEDARVAALLLQKCLEHTGAEDCFSLVQTCGYRIGSLQPGGMFDSFTSLKALSKKTAQAQKARNRGTAGQAVGLVPTVSEFNPDHVFYRKNIVFTGRLSALTRQEAMQRVVDCGGSCGDTVELKTNYLVIGQKDYLKLMDGLDGSTKIRKAKKLALAGIPVTLLSEQQFVEMLS